MGDQVGYLIGIDGGGTSTRALVRSRDGAVVGAGRAGPSALGQGVAQAWRHIQEAVQAAFVAANIRRPGWRQCAMVAALSGASHGPWRTAFLAADPGLAHLAAETDAFAMLVGAHGGRPGAIVISGTGSVAEALAANGERTTVGGWGFPAGDEGSGAWLGLHAVRHAQQAFDGRANASPLARRVWMLCGDEREALQAWCAQAGQHGYAQLARAVFECEERDPAAAALLQQATAALEDLALAIDPRGRLPLAVGGSIAERLAPRMRPALRNRLVQPRGGAVEGALELAAQAVQRQELEEIS
ncbi:ATPase [Caenimonas sedimenti]|uniref:ATPase n=1 Tax=Caenimonas sedimenti TaxID=2596921 RepID=A0A562ZVE4_9BURK|nr:BadF/BadG/BcrA/BcrD ATPase family protein [Caenimonas sedimenti]TWO72572.1 ATPase [Caenimonas sedimenti]